MARHNFTTQILNNLILSAFFQCVSLLFAPRPHFRPISFFAVHILTNSRNLTAAEKKRTHLECLFVDKVLWSCYCCVWWGILLDAFNMPYFWGCDTRTLCTQCLTQHRDYNVMLFCIRRNKIRPEMVAWISRISFPFAIQTYHMHKHKHISTHCPSLCECGIVNGNLCDGFFGAVSLVANCYLFSGCDLNRARICPRKRAITNHKFTDTFDSVCRWVVVSSLITNAPFIHLLKPMQLLYLSPALSIPNK